MICINKNDNTARIERGSKMSAIGVKVTRVGVVLQVRETQAMGNPDNFQDRMISTCSGGKKCKKPGSRHFYCLSNLPALPSLEDLRKVEAYDLDAFYVPQHGQWVVLYWTWFQERAMGQQDETCHGPFVLHGYPAPTEDDISSADANGLLVRTRIPLSSLPEHRAAA